MDITKQTVQFLKAIKSDLYEEQGRIQNNLQIINQELASRANKDQENKNMDETTNYATVEEVPMEAETQQEVEETAE
jgi:hypothetical protein